MQALNSDVYRRREHLAALVALLLCAFALFANTFGAEWNYDDFPVIVENPDVLSFGNFFKDQFPGRPLREFTFVIDHALFGMEPAGWHIQHLFWHALCAWLLWLLVVRLDFSRPTAWIAALFFLVHPLQVEAVANISHRKESLALAFCLMAMLAFIRGCHSEGPHRIGWVAAAFALVGVGCLGKQTAVAAFPLFLVYEWIYLPRERWCLLRWWKPLAAASAVCALGLAWWLMFGQGGEKYLSGIRAVLSFKANCLDPVQMTFDAFSRTILKAWLFMTAKWVLPVGLAAEYIITVPPGWFDPWVLGGLALAGGWLTAMVLLIRRKSPLLFPVAWTGLFFLPTSNIWPLAYLAADRYLYAPTVGVAILAAVLLVRLFAAQPKAAWATAGVLLIVLSVLTWRQNEVWRTPETLWVHAVEINPTSGFALSNMGTIEYLKGNLAKAYEYYSRAVDSNPLNPAAQHNMGMVFEKIGDKPRMYQFYRNFLLLKHDVWAKDQKALEARLAKQYGARFVGGQFVFDK
ncbi:MAG: hypothetical protein NDI73_09345 [Desulfuromonadales bacterium]|nr:hypothetical protein [Desulfuromonadales bacterium]